MPAHHVLLDDARDDALGIDLRVAPEKRPCEFRVTDFRPRVQFECVAGNSINDWIGVKRRNNGQRCIHGNTAVVLWIGTMRVAHRRIGAARVVVG
jgi:hypothetical protein